MISIIISSVNAEALNRVSNNIQRTIGIEYELLAYDNKGGEKGLCEIYNEQSVIAKYDYLCFMHEDVEFETENWGNNILETFFSDSTIAVIGTVGSSYKSYAPSGWGVENFHGETTFANYRQYYKRSDKTAELLFNNPTKFKSGEVVCVDGMWLCTKKRIALEHPFDQDLLKGFHCYDVDFCLNVGQFYKIVVTYDVLISHFSEGSFDKYWLADTIKLHEKWQHTLPRSIYVLTPKRKRVLEKRALKSLIVSMVENGNSLKFILDTLKSHKYAPVMNWVLCLKLKYYCIRYYLTHNKQASKP